MKRNTKDQSEYPNHTLLKKNRLIRLKESKGKCEVCDRDAYCVHHLDESKDNHELKNLIVLCRKCHSVLHNGRKDKKRPSKYRDLYGMNAQEMADKYGGGKQRYQHMHKHGTLKGFLAGRN